ncbi:hypothetical protein C8R42DRAFT_637104 [Lentinula raphanica]|nr:hypothetical protein C8R42DRAFT_637104 [Lentinula raphanica]
MTTPRGHFWDPLRVITTICNSTFYKSFTVSAGVSTLLSKPKRPITPQGHNSGVIGTIRIGAGRPIWSVTEGVRPAIYESVHDALREGLEWGAGHLKGFSNEADAKEDWVAKASTNPSHIIATASPVHLRDRTQKLQVQCRLITAPPFMFRLSASVLECLICVNDEGGWQMKYGYISGEGVECKTSLQFKGVLLYFQILQVYKRLWTSRIPILQGGESQLMMLANCFQIEGLVMAQSQIGVELLKIVVTTQRGLQKWLRGVGMPVTTCHI